MLMMILWLIVELIQIAWICWFFPCQSCHIILIVMFFDYNQLWYSCNGFFFNENLQNMRCRRCWCDLIYLLRYRSLGILWLYRLLSVLWQTFFFQIVQQVSQPTDCCVGSADWCDTWYFCKGLFSKMSILQYWVFLREKP